MKYFVSLVILLSAQVASAGLIESQKDNVEVYTAADKASPVVSKLKKGDTLTSGERSGMYWSVKTKDGKSGFVSVLAVKVKPEDKAGLNDAMREAVKSGRSQSTADGGRARSAVMGVRGLDDTSDSGLAANLRPNLHAVYSMEDYEIPRGRVDQQAATVAGEIEKKMGAGK